MREAGDSTSPGLLCLETNVEMRLPDDWSHGRPGTQGWNPITFHAQPLMNIELPPASATRSVASIRRYFDESLDLEMGELKARMILDFFLAEIAPSVYNLAIADVQADMRDRVADLEGACSREEFSHWPRSTGRRPA